MTAYFWRDMVGILGQEPDSGQVDLSTWSMKKWPKETASNVKGISLRFPALIWIGKNSSDEKMAITTTIQQYNDNNKNRLQTAAEKEAVFLVLKAGSVCLRFSEFGNLKRRRPLVLEDSMLFQLSDQSWDKKNAGKEVRLCSITSCCSWTWEMITLQ